MINPQWLELPMSETYFHGPKDVRATEVRLYLFAMSLFVCVEILRPSQSSGVMSSAVSLPNHMFTGQA